MSQRIRLPSINELTAKYPLNDDNSSTSPNLSQESNKLPGISSQNFRYFQTSPANYVFTGKSKLSPTITFDQPPPPPPAPHTTSNYEYYQYQTANHFPQQMYYHPVFYPQSPPSNNNIQYAVPVVINRPTNKCHRCGTTETPEWRRGPNGVRTLCNACGLFHAKLVKRKGAALAAEEVLNNKVTKGKNGRRISIKKHMLNENIIKKSPLNTPHYHDRQLIPPPMTSNQFIYSSGSAVPDYRQPILLLRE